MSSAINHKIRSCRGIKKQRHTLAPKKTPLITPAKSHKHKNGRISSLFFLRTVSG